MKAYGNTLGARHKETPRAERVRLLAGIADELAKYLLADG